MLKAIIIDDEVNGVESLETLIQENCPEIRIVAKETSPVKAVKLIEKLAPDVLFLDIQMPDMNGFTLLEKIKHLPVNVIFTTAYTDYAIKALRHDAVDYLLKPVIVTELVNSVNRLAARIKEKSAPDIQFLLDKLSGKRLLTTLAINTLSEIIYVDTEHIIRLEADSNYTNIILDNGKNLVTTRTLKEYEEALDPDRFFRVFKTYIIQLKHVERFVKTDGGYIVMSDGTQIPVSREKRQELLDRLMKR